jgi:hypothetical protein
MVVSHVNFYHLSPHHFSKIDGPEPGRKPRRMTAPAVIHPT